MTNNIHPFDAEIAQQITMAANEAEATLRAAGNPTAEDVAAARQKAAERVIADSLGRLTEPHAYLDQARAVLEATGSLPSGRDWDLGWYILDAEPLVGDAFLADVIEKFGNLKRDEVERGLAIGAELIAKRATDLEYEAAELRALIAARAAV